MKTIGPYEFDESKGREGGMAIVYRARDTQLKRDVALKVLHPDKETDEAWVDRFKREARIAASLGHDNIVKILGAQLNQSPHYYAMEFLEGGNLEQRVHAGGMRPEEALAIIGPICEALEYAHKQGVVHHDIKPSNIMFDGKGNPVLTDFGIAEAADETRERTREIKPGEKSQDNRLYGTLLYMSPERLNWQRGDHRSDLWSLAVVVYQMLTGRAPFVNEGQIKNDPPPPLHVPNLDPVTVGRLERVLVRALEKSPNERYQSAGGFIRALLPPPPEGWWKALSRTMRKVQVWVAERAGLIALLSVVVAGILFLALHGKTRDGGPQGNGPAPVMRPKPPSALRATRTSPDTVSLSWEDNSNNEDGFRIERSPDNGGTWPAIKTVPRNVTSYTDNAVAPGQGYDYRVLAHNAKGYSQPSGAVTVPPLVPPLKDMDRVDAERSCTNRDLRLAWDKGKREHHPTIPEGHVIRTDPPATTPVEKHTEIIPIVSAGPPPRQPVPKVIGESADQAKRTLTDRGYRYGVGDKKCDDSVPRGYVLWQNPQADGAQEPGIAVRVVLSLGPPVKVPDVIGQSEDQAVETLEKAGLSPKVIRKHNPATEGKVFGTDVNLGQEICPDKPVTIWVSKGPIPPPVNEVPVPNVVGEAANDARIRLERARFGYRVGASEFSERVPEGHVISQNPRGGLKRRPGIIVSVTLSLGRRIVLPTRKVPSVLGMSEQEARSTIELAGFKYGRSRSEFDDEPKGTAIGQSPAPGALRPLATAVRIVLSRGRKPEPRPEPCRLRCELPRVGPECDKLFCSERERKDHYVVVHGLP